MGTYLAFLRAVNLGPTRKFPSADIRRVAEQAGFEDAATYINSGNLRVHSRMRSASRIAAALERAFEADRGFAVPTVVFAASEFRVIARDATELAEAYPAAVRHYVWLLPAGLDAAAVTAVEAASSEAGRLIVRGRAAHALLRPVYTAGNVDPLHVAGLLPDATTRNATVIGAVARLWC